ncbi:glycosyltransferase family 2 protein [Sulfurimonas sp.]|uniref:glycosyltransferase family 2 protein n=1 Tax=Sulfurimonas sp. TaxID=2022749 RepID=UPI003D0BF588
MLIKKILLIIWHEKSTTPFRIIEKSYARYKKHGWQGMVDRLNKEYYRLYPYDSRKVDQEKFYKRWIKQNEQDILHAVKLEYNPLISIITPTYNTEKKYLLKMLESVLAQTYTKWELCIADDASSNEDVIQTLKEYETMYKNIKVMYRDTNGHISEASNSALELATGEYVVFLDHDDMLSPNALYETVKKLNENKNLKLIYSDEDKIDENGKRHTPHFKSGWNPDMFFSQNYICHLVCIKKEIVDEIGGFRKEYEGSQDYDLLLRVIDKLQDNEIDRIEKILYHWRAIKGSTAYGTGEKNYAHERGLKALKDYFRNKDIKITVENGLLNTTYKVNYPIPEVQPLVSILIPTRNEYELLKKCIDSIFSNTTYTNYEIIIIDNQTTCKETLDYLEELNKEHNITILKYNKKFNFSAINNFGVQYAKGELIAFVNNDVEVISQGWLTEMVVHALRKDVGAVGAKLYYEDNAIQHAGVVLGIGSVAGHSHKYFQKNMDGYWGRLKIVQNFSAVTAACLVVQKKLFEEVNGFNEKDLKVAFNDVDFCLKLLENGYKNIWTPYVELYHYESKSRGKEDNPMKIERFNYEVSYMQNRWSKYLKYDQYYNSNLTLKYEDFRL